MLVLRRSRPAGQQQKESALMTGWSMGTEAWIAMGAWALVMVVVVWLLVREPHPGTSEDPSAILRARFARGEITEDEFRQATVALDDEPPIAPARGARPDARPHAVHHTHGQEARHD
jgi:Short C-terminal domain